jgi:hypothetical protein
VKGRLLYAIACTPENVSAEARPAQVVLATVNDRAHGLGRALPNGGITVFESTARGEMLAGEERLRDYAAGQDVELELGPSAQVFARCASRDRTRVAHDGAMTTMVATLTNANPSPAHVRLTLGGGEVRIGGLRKVALKDGARVYEATVPANGRRELSWTIVAE